MNGNSTANPVKPDIKTRADILLLVRNFYKKLLADHTISYIFTDVAKIDLEHHLPILVDFWDTVLFDSGTYQKNAIQPHLILHQQSKFEKHHFDTWLKHFGATIDEWFEGEVSFIAKQRAKSIATIMQIKMAQIKQP